MILRSQIERSARAKKRRRLTLFLTGMAIGCVSLSTRSAIPLIVYNPTRSAPLGYYRTLAAKPLTRGDWVLLKTPATVRQMADERGYIPATVPMIKSVVALAGDTVCADGPRISINGVPVAMRLRLDHRGRPLPWWTGCRKLSPDEIFVLNRAAPSSFDGRYFGPVPVRSVRARLVHL